MASDLHHHRGPGWRWLPVLLFFALAAGFLLSSEHRAHAIGLFPLLALLALCPLMHVFMHGGHGRHEPAAEHEDDPGGDGADVVPGRPASAHRH